MTIWDNVNGINKFALCATISSIKLQEFTPWSHCFCLQIRATFCGEGMDCWTYRALAPSDVQSWYWMKPVSRATPSPRGSLRHVEQQAIISLLRNKLTKEYQAPHFLWHCWSCIPVLPPLSFLLYSQHFNRSFWDMTVDVGYFSLSYFVRLIIWVEMNLSSDRKYLGQ